MGLNLGWVYLFIGIVIGSAVIPLWNMMTRSKASGEGAVVAALSGLGLELITWLIAAGAQSGEVTVASLLHDMNNIIIVIIHIIHILIIK